MALHSTKKTQRRKRAQEEAEEEEEEEEWRDARKMENLTCTANSAAD